MPKIIKIDQVISDDWQVIAKDAQTELAQGPAFIPLQMLLANPCILDERSETGVWLDSDEPPYELAPYLNKLTHIAINFPVFGDGRGYSYARILRDEMGYKGELRAIGDVLRDQLFYMKRCGFDAYAVREDKDINEALEGLNDFSDAYQCATVIDQPLFRRRAS